MSPNQTEVKSYHPKDNDGTMLVVVFCTVPSQRMLYVLFPVLRLHMKGNLL